MRITLELPDNTVSIKYITIEGTKIMLDKAVTLGMIVDVKRGDERAYKEYAIDDNDYAGT